MVDQEMLSIINAIHHFLNYHNEEERNYVANLNWGAVVAQWIRPQTLNREVPGSNLLAAAVCALGQGTLSSLPSPLERT